VRIDKYVLGVLQLAADTEGLSRNDEIEEGCRMRAEQYLREHNQTIEPEHQQGRFLWKVLPMDMQKRTMGFWAFCGCRHDNPFDELFRRCMMERVDAYMKDPATTYTANLKGLERRPDLDLSK
jgi:hypothetical protein